MARRRLSLAVDAKGLNDGFMGLVVGWLEARLDEGGSRVVVVVVLLVRGKGFLTLSLIFLNTLLVKLYFQGMKWTKTKNAIVQSPANLSNLWQR
jgi:hypothetical protein